MFESKKRVLPNNIAAEQGLLGALLIDAGAFERVPDQLGDADFYQPAHQRIFAAARSLYERGQLPSPVTLAGSFADDAELAAAGGADYLADLAANAVGTFNVPDYCRTIIDCARRRRVIELAEVAMEDAYAVDFARDASSVIEQMEERLFSLAETGQADRGPVSMAESAVSTVALIEQYWQGKIRGLMSGIHALDSHMNGFFPAELTILGARPGMGKTAMAFTIGYNAADSLRDKIERGDGKHSVLGFSLEMSHEQLTMRLLARETGIPIQAMRREKGFRQEHFREFVAAQGRLSHLPLHVDDTPALTAAQIMSRARRHKRRHGLDLVIVDYLGLMRASRDFINKTHELEEMTQGLKIMAKKLDVPVLLLCQLNRGVEGREDKRPMLSDLRDSGSLEQDADNVIFLYREEYYLGKQGEPERKPREDDADYAARVAHWQRRKDESRGKAEIIIAKNRQGPEETVRCGFDPVKQLFYDLQP